jgi:DNA-binding SARP family transcriptional activator/tetratricopeptide (TPR) repeat protein
VRFRVLGPFSIVGPDGPVAIAGPRQRGLLALLVAHVGRVLSAERLADELWEGSPPTSDAALRVHVARLRQALAVHGMDGLIETKPTGYVLATTADDIDSHQFVQLADGALALEATSRPAAALAQLDRALRLWDGPAYGNVGDLVALHAEIERLEARRLQAEEDRARLLLESGDVSRAISLLVPLVRAHPLHERFTGLLMVGFARHGRQADALRAFADTKRTLVDELGLDPSDPLVRLEQAVLMQDEPALSSFLRGGQANPPVVITRPRGLPSSLTRAGEAPFTGRAAELHALDDLIAGLPDRSSGLVLITGEPGIGKTRLAAEAARLALAHGASVIHGHSDPEGVLVFQPFVEALSPLAGDPLFDEILSMLAKGAGDAEAHRHRFFEMTASMVERTVSRVPIVAILDDAHWMDRPSIALIRFVLRRVVDGPLLVVMTARSTELPADHPLGVLHADFARVGRATTIPLGPLAESEAMELVRAVSDVADAAAIARATGGNPFFLIELARASRLPGLPMSVQAVLQQRLAGLDRPMRLVLSTAALLGATFGVSIVVAVTGLDEDEVLNALEAATVANLVAPKVDDAEDWVFVHEIVREELISQLSEPRRRRLHRDIATWLARYRSSSVAEIARHRFEAVPIVAPEVAARSLLVAAEEAVSLGAFEHALVLIERARSLLGVADGNEALRAEAIVLMAEAHMLLGHNAKARQYFDDAVRLIGPTGDTDLLSRAFTVRLAFGLDLGGDEALRDQLEQVISVLRERPLSAALVRAHSCLVYERMFAGDTDGAEAAAATALALAAELGDWREHARAIHAEHQRLVGTAEPIARRFELAREAQALFVDTSDSLAEIYALGDLLTDLLAVGDLTSFRDQLPHYTELADRVGRPLNRWLAVAMAAAAAIAAGDDDAEDLVRQAGQLGGRLEVGISGLVYGAQMFNLRGLQGRLHELGPKLDLFLAGSRSEPVLAYAVVRGRVAAGDLEGARSLFDTLMAAPLPSTHRSFLWTSELVVAAECVHLLGTAEQARAVRSRLAPFAGQFAVVNNGVLLVGAADRSLALLDWTLGQRDEALERLRCLEARCASSGLRPLVQQIESDLERLTDLVETS